MTFPHGVTVPDTPAHDDSPQRMIRPRRTVRRPQFLQYYARGSTIPLPDMDSDELATPVASEDDSDFITPETSEVDSEELVSSGTSEVEGEIDESNSGDAANDSNPDSDNSTSAVVPTPVPPDPGKCSKSLGLRKKN